MLKEAFGDDTDMSQPRVYEWYKRFQEDREDIEDDARSGRPSTSTNDEHVEKVKEIVLANRRITIRKVAEEIGISYGSREVIFTNVLNMKRVAAKFTPKLLNFQEKQHRVTIAKPPCSPDMAPCDFFLFPKLKRTLKGQHCFSTIDEIKAKSLIQLETIPKEAFHQCFSNWKLRWQ
ncbi:putative uncharacterized protein FLJ37770 [Harpegnathos saltator]|uniref:putative uncharacterized protein FLJ37770 n=1 Tax=Harpegnathos saltator TaxID=610380 RepID=UPI00059044BC|nr:putative uncharacterized protein FLJ37770 [Harpegnathos saltator]